MNDELYIFHKFKKICKGLCNVLKKRNPNCCLQKKLSANVRFVVTLQQTTEVDLSSLTPKYTLKDKSQKDLIHGLRARIRMESCKGTFSVTP